MLSGCTDLAACNYNSSSTLNTDNTVCTYVDGICETCEEGLVVDNDADNDGVCNADEVVGCQDASACNYMELATDAGDCIYSTDLDACATCSGEQDGTGVIVDNDADNDGVCNADEIEGCTDIEANNYNLDATEDDGSCLYDPTCQTIAIPSGWSMFSSYIIPDDMDLTSVLSPIVDSVIIVKDNNGAPYMPEYNLNAIGQMTVGQGYLTKSTDSVSLEICGDYAYPEDHPIDLIAGWNMIGYLRLDPAAADAVLADITSTGNLVIAKDYSGNAFLPQYAFNGIGDMLPGQGYQIKVYNADVLQYLSNDDSYRMSAIEVTENNVSHFAKVAATDNNMTVVIEDAAWDTLPIEGSEIAAFDKNGNMVGSAIYSSPVTVVTVWGDDVTTTSKDGMLVSESVSFKVWNTNEVLDFTVEKWIEGSSLYQVNGISVASTIETNNVITELNASERVLVRVINVLGQEVNMDDEPFKGTVLFKVYDDGSVEKFVQ